MKNYYANKSGDTPNENQSIEIYAVNDQVNVNNLEVADKNQRLEL